MTDRLTISCAMRETLAYALLASAADALDAGAPLDRIQGHYVTRAALAHLGAIEQHIADLADLTVAAR